LNKRGVQAKVVSVNDANDIDREVTLYDPNHVILEALWVTPGKLREVVSLRRHRHRSWNIRIHSKTPFLSNEGIAMGWIHGYNQLQYEFNNVSVSGNNLDFVNDLGQVTNTFVDYLPNIYEIPDNIRVHETDSGPEFINIGCFGAIRPLKNHLQQAFAAIMFAERLGKRLRFHINASRTEQKGDEVLRNLRDLFAGLPQHQLVEHGWLTHPEFVELVKTMDFGMQVSFSESFNIVTADMVSKGVPVVVSTDVSWMPLAYRAVPTDTNDIMKKMALVYRHPIIASNANIKALNQHNKKAIKAWMSYLKLAESEHPNVNQIQKNSWMSAFKSWFKRK